MNRKAISTRLRFDIFKRDNFTCQYCGSHPPKVILHIDHVIPVKEDGGNDETNLVTACSECNGGKAAIPLKVVPLSLRKKAALIRERELQLQGYTSICLQQRARMEEDTWRVADIFMEIYKKDSIRRDWFASISNFVKQLGLVETLEAMDIAVAFNARDENQRFRYFCGVCWRKIKGPQL